MRGDTLPRPLSFSDVEEDEEGKLSVKPSLIGTDESAPSKKKKNEDVSAQANFKLKRHREEPFQGSSSFSKKKTTSRKSLDKSGIDLEELLARTYPKDISAPVESAKQMPTEGSDRRSNRKQKRPVKRVSDSAKKWSGDEEISFSMALLECSSPGGEINMAAFYQRAKESLNGEVSNSQLYEKMRSMKKRFLAIQSKLKEQNVAEDEFPYRTHQEPALFRIWKRIWGNNGDNHGFRSENPKENGVQDLRLIEFENPRENGVENSREIENENARGNGAENSREISDENLIENEGENSREYDPETPREKGGESPMVNDDERGKSGETEGENLRDIGFENPTKIKFTNPRGSGVENEKEGEEQNLQSPVSHEAQNIENNRVCELLQSKSGRFEDNIKILFEKTESRLQASIESSINRVAVANFQPFGGFGPEMGMGIFLSRRMKELIDGLNSVKEVPGLDSMEAQELQQKWHALKIQEVRIFCKSLELLQKQCRLILNNAESSSSTDNHGS
ncbi:hypothetical protein SUGI_0206930 [Cryptomeria japonica]|uniref:GLABROUS1 enhancer-binding protein-like n=1 Tax=Cryptomeria japonica TaxID=3369 RepID=UPI002408AA43|nr:GLABROUS1 enhancer-binding protein-like [Cryptomeria japonica]GLJ13174.1 hypothetical protein SUGI_0206930 [Cryptomeria japonica]